MLAEVKILLIEDNEKFSHDLKLILEFSGELPVKACSNNWQQIVEAATNKKDFVVTIIGHCQFTGLDELLHDLHRWDSGLPFIVLGKQALSASLDPGIATKLIGQLDYPLRYQPLLDTLHKARIYRDHYNLLQDIGADRAGDMFRSLVGQSKQIQQVRQMMGQVADKEVTVLITGDSGTGKEVVARNLHMNSSRANKPFVPINCGAIPPELLESELFGHEKGAFTGAISARIGRFGLADGGTLFLDEIGDMPLSMQVKLLRVLQEHCFERVGGSKTIHTDVRILAATHKNLEDMIEKGEFRQDLYYRINVFPIEMPSLKERGEDIPLLLNELITRLEREKRGSVRFNSSAITSLSRHDWPGNVRELANLVERMAILFPHSVVGVSDLPLKFRHVSEEETHTLDLPQEQENTATAIEETAASEETVASDGAVPNASANDRPSAHDVSNSTSEPRATALLPLNGLDLKEYLANLEKDLIEQALEDSSGVVVRAANRLHIRRTTLVEKMRKYSMQKKV